MYLIIIIEGLSLSCAGFFDDYVEAIAQCKKIKRGGIVIFMVHVEQYTR